MNKTANNPNQPPNLKRTVSNASKSQPTPILQNKANLNTPLTPLTP